MKQRSRGGLAAAYAVLFVSLLHAPTVSGQLSPFTEESQARALNQTFALSPAFGYGVALVDLDNDGDADVVTFGAASFAIELFENDGSGYFTNRTAGSSIPLQPNASGISAADFDGDGDLDLFVTNWNAANQMFRNLGNFQFERAINIGIVSEFGPSTGSAWGDYDGDGWLDLFVPNWTPGSGMLNIPDRLYHNQGDGTFVEVSSTLGLTGLGAGYQGAWFDHDRDGDLDLYISNDKCYGNGLFNRLYENQNGTLVDISTTSGANICIDSMGLAVGDFDGDLKPDIYATNIPAGNPLLLRSNDGRFQNESQSTGTLSFLFGWGTRFLDFDNDTFQELYVNNINGLNRMYDHNGSFPCGDFATILGVADAQDSYGLAVADVDADGDLDMVTTTMPGPIRLWINHEGEKRNWARFEVVGTHPNLFAVGARVDIRVGDTWQTQAVVAGGNYKSQDHRIVHFGLADATTVDEVLVVWPGGQVSRTLGSHGANQLWTLFPPSRLGDQDGDGTVDADDFQALLACAGGLVVGCEVMDFDGDADVDVDDAAAFSLVYAGVDDDCNVNGSSDLVDLFDGTSLDVNANAVPDECEVLGAPAGRVPDGDTVPGVPLLLDQLSSGEVALTWSASCAADSDYAVYAGPIGSFDGHQPLTCSTVGLTEWNGFAADDSYFLVVPLNGSNEGSYGVDGGGVQRPASAGACASRLIGSCGG